MPLTRFFKVSYARIGYMGVNERSLGQRIAAARRDVGLTLAQCAGRSGLDSSALAKIETGQGRLNATELTRLAGVLEMRLEWFFQEAPKAVLLRRNAAELGAASSRLDRFTERLAREAEFLTCIGTLDIAAASALAFPETSEQAEAAAVDARAILGYDTGEPAIELSRHAASAGLLVFCWKLGDGAADGASLLLNRGGVAVVNGSRRVGHRRLTLAHELGHYLFADEYSTDCRVAGATAENRENLIDRFARALLLPMNALAYLWRNGAGTRISALRIASEYQVDTATLAQRLTELRMVSPEVTAQVRSIRARRSSIAELEPLAADELVPPELPDVYVKAVLDAYREEEISAARASDLLLHTWEEDDLPDLPPLPSNAVCSFVS